MAHAKAHPRTPRAKSAEVPLAAPTGAVRRADSMVDLPLYVDGGFHIVG